MKFSCHQQNLVKALNIVSKAVTSRTTIPILKGILLEVKDGTLTLHASDLDISIKNTIDVEDYENGSVVVMAKLFGDIIRKLDSDNIIIETDENNKVNITCKNSKFVILGESPEEFPIMKKTDEEAESIILKKDILKKMIENTSFAASIDESRGIITGVLLELTKEEIKMVAIDGYRLAITKESQLNKKEKNIVISARTLNELGKILGEIPESEENVKLIFSNKKATFIFGKVQAELKIMDGEFIAYKGIIPKESKISVVLKRKELIESIGRASLLSRAGKNNLIKLSIMDNILEISSDSEEGNVKENILIEKEGENLTIGFNAQYLIDILKVIDEEKIKLLFNTAISPCMVESLNEKKYEYMVLPVRIN